MKLIKFNQDKNRQLKLTRGINFDDVSKIVKKNELVEIIDHPNKKRYKNQKIFLVKIKDSIFAIPFIEEKDYIFLKTVYPSQKYTKKYLHKL